VARAFLYRRGALGDRPVVLWVPGQSTSETDMPSLTALFERLLARGVDVVFYQPPYHLDRTPKGYGSGDAFLSTDFSDHLQVFAQALSDMRGLSAWLRAQGVKVLGGVGSSMGASLLVRMCSWSGGLDFLSSMIPVLRWDELIQTPEMSPVRSRLLAQGLTDQDVGRLYRAMDATGDRPRLDPSLISVLYGRFDRIAPETPILDWTRRWGVRRVRAYDRGHALFSANGSLPRELANSVADDVEVVLRLPETAMPAQGHAQVRAPPGFPMAD
jgi:hypothetical protein